MKKACAEQGLHLVEFVTPGTTDERISETCTTADGFIYCVSINGVTGVRKIDYSPINKVIEHVKKQTATPCAVGFGIGGRPLPPCDRIPRGHGGAHLPDEALCLEHYFQALEIFTMGVIEADRCLSAQD